MSSTLTLSEYTKIGEKIISKYLSLTKKKPLNFSYDELLGEIVHKLVYADLEYDPTKSTMTLERYRAQQAIIAIKQVNNRNSRYRYNMGKYVGSLGSASTKAIHYDEIEIENIPKILINYAKANAALTQTQKEHIDLYLDGKTFREIAEIHNESMANAWQIHNTAIGKMRGVLSMGNKNGTTKTS